MQLCCGRCIFYCKGVAVARHSQCCVAPCWTSALPRLDVCMGCCALFHAGLMHPLVWPLD